MWRVFERLDIKDIVIDDSKPVPGSPIAEIEGYNNLCRLARDILVQAMTAPVLGIVDMLDSPHLIWKQLRETYHCVDTTLFMSQVTATSNIALCLDRNKPIQEFIDKYNSQWARMIALIPSHETDPQFAVTASPGQVEYLRDLKRFFDHDSTKRDYLKETLREQYPYVIQHLRNYPDLTYEELCQFLLELLPSHSDYRNFGNMAPGSAQQEENHQQPADNEYGLEFWAHYL